MMHTKDECIATLKAALEMIRSKCGDNHSGMEPLANNLKGFKDIFTQQQQKSIEKEEEHGFLICKKDEELIPGEICIGQKECIKLVNCGEYNRVGSFHTHYEYNIPPIFSGNDILYGLLHNDDVMCISGMDVLRNKDIVACYKFLKETDTYKKFKKEAKNLSADINGYNEELERFAEAIREYTSYEELPDELKEKHKELLEKADEVDIRKKNFVTYAEMEQIYLVDILVEIVLGRLRELRPKPKKLLIPPFD